MKTLATVICMLLYSSLSAQISVRLAVVDSTHRPLPAATISIISATTNNSGVCDKKGRFSIDHLHPGGYTIITSYQGYRQNIKSVHLSADTSLLIFMQDTISQLDQVVVSASRATLRSDREKTIYNVASSVTASGTDVLTAIGQVPGIKISDHEIVLAGRGGVKVMVNNRLLNLAGLDLVRYLRSISASGVATIEVSTNPSAARDAEGNAGLVNIRLKRNASEGFSGSIQGSYKLWRHNPRGIFRASNFWMTDAGTSLNYNKDRWSAYATFSEDEDHELEGFETDISYPRQRWVQTDTGDYVYHNYAITAGIDFQVNPKVSVGAGYTGGRAIYAGNDHVNNPVYGAAGSPDSALRTYATYRPVAFNNAFNLHSTINLDPTGKKISMNADYFHYNRNDISDFESRVFLPNGHLSPASGAQFFDTNGQNIGVYTVTADLDIPSPFATWSFGIKLSFINNYSNAFYYNRDSAGTLTYNNELSNEFRYIENTQAAYGALSGQRDRWTYAGGIRAELTQTNGHTYVLNQTAVSRYLRLFPNLSLDYRLDSVNSLGLSVGRRINRPSFWNLNPYKSLYTAFSYAQGNPFLQPEYSTNIEISHTFKSLLVSGIFLSITQNGFNNVTVADPNSNIVTTTPLNFILTSRVGISETLSLQIGRAITSNTQATIYHTDARSRLDYIESIEGFGAYLSTGFTAYLNPEKTLTAAVSAWYQFPEVDHIGRAERYYRVDAGLQAQVLQKKLSLAFNLNDAFRSSASAVTTKVNGLVTKFTNFQLNRFLQISAAYRFGGNPRTSKKNIGNEDERRRSGL